MWPIFSEAVSLPTDLVAFFEEHRRCGEMDGGAKEDRVWMACESCGAQLARPILDEPQRLETGRRRGGDNGRRPGCAKARAFASAGHV